MLLTLLFYKGVSSIRKTKVRRSGHSGVAGLASKTDGPHPQYS